MLNKLHLPNIMITNFFYSMSTIAIEKFIAQDYQKFDAHVGDTSCQIRACWLLDKGKNEELRLKLVSESKIISFEFSNKSNFVLFEPSEELVFITCAYILAEYVKFDVFGYPNGIDFKRLKALLRCSMTSVKKIIRQLQSLLSKLSTAYIIVKARILCFSKKELEALRALKLEGDDKKQILPCYLLSKVVFSILKKNKTPIILRSKVKISTNTVVKDICFLPNQFGIYSVSNLESKSPSLILVNQVVIDSIDLLNYFFKQIIFSINIETVFHLNQAAHQQFCGSKLKHLKFNAFEHFKNQTLRSRFSHIESKFLRLKNTAIRHGFSRDSPQKVVIKHIFAEIPLKFDFQSDLVLKTGYPLYEPVEMEQYEEVF